MTQPASSYNDDLRLAHVLADSVDDQTMSRFKALDLQIETKPDLTPVTDADKAAEESIRGQLSRSRPAMPSSARSSAVPATAPGAGSLIPSTEPRTSSAGFRSGPR